MVRGLIRSNNFFTLFSVEKRYRIEGIIVTEGEGSCGTYIIDHEYYGYLLIRVGK